MTELVKLSTSVIRNAPRRRASLIQSGGQLGHLTSNHRTREDDALSP
jgi:hypothetical protein